MLRGEPTASQGRAVRTGIAAVLAAAALVLVLGGSPARAAPIGHGVTAGGGVSDERFDRALTRARSAGIGWIRVNCEWTYVMGRNSSGQNSYYWGGCDRAIDRVRAAGLRPLLFSFYSHASLCTTAPDSVIGDHRRQRWPACNGDRGYPEYREFVHRLVSRYGPSANGYGPGYGRNQISHWEIGNEPNHSAFFPAYASQPARAAHEYARILAAAHDAAKAADPNSTVVIGGLATGGGKTQTYNPNFVSDILNDATHPAGGNFDVLNFHTYEDVERNTVHLRSLRSQLGGRAKPVWVTEVSYPSVPRLQQALSFSGNYPSGEAGQAAYLRKVLGSLTAQGVELIFWNSLVDPYNDRAFCSNGLMYTVGFICPTAPPSGLPELREKASFGAYSDLIANGAPSGTAQPTVKVYRPEGYRRLRGQVYAGRGAVRRLGDNDASRLELASARAPSGAQVADFYAHASIAAGDRAAARRLTAIYDGNASSSYAALGLHVFNHSSGRWVRVDGPRTGVTSDRGFGWSTSSPRDYISSAGEVRFRVRGTRRTGFRTRTDLVRFRLER